MSETLSAGAIERELRNLNAILAVSKALSSEVQLDNLLQVIVQKTLEVMEAERTSIFLYNEGRQALLCLPLLRSNGKLIGVIQVLNKNSGGVFDERDESLLTAFGAHAAVALERAQLIEAYIEQQRLAETLKLARETQMSMLPKHFPAFLQRTDFDLYAVIEPAREVGGDFYNFLLLDENHLGVAIGDVSGKGIPTALFMSMTKTLLRVAASKHQRPEVVLTELNQDICRDNEAGMFVTVFYGVVDLRTGELEYSSGGHNPPYVLSRNGTVAALPLTKSMALGVMEHAVYHARQYALQPGEGLFLYTDGVTEAMDSSSALFSEQLLEKGFLIRCQAVDAGREDAWHGRR